MKPAQNFSDERLKEIMQELKVELNNGKAVAKEYIFLGVRERLRNLGRAAVHRINYFDYVNSFDDLPQKFTDILAAPSLLEDARAEYQRTHDASKFARQCRNIATIVAKYPLDELGEV